MSRGAAAKLKPAAVAAKATHASDVVAAEIAALRGEVATGRGGPGVGVLNGNTKAKVTGIGPTRKQVHQARARPADAGVAPSWRRCVLRTGRVAAVARTCACRR